MIKQQQQKKYGLAYPWMYTFDNHNFKYTVFILHITRQIG